MQASHSWSSKFQIRRSQRNLQIVGQRGISSTTLYPLKLTWEIHIHAIGDKAITEALDALEFARNANGSRDSRHHIAHIQIPNPKDLPRYKIECHDSSSRQI